MHSFIIAGIQCLIKRGDIGRTNFFNIILLSVSLPAKISVIITAYNRREFLLEAVNSVLMNDFPRELYEIVVSKNFQDDYIDDFLQKNMVTLINTGDINIGEQLYLAVSNSSGEIICFLDDDDRFKIDKLKYIYSRFSQDRQLVYYNNSTDSIDDRSNPIPGNIHRRISDNVVIMGPSADEIAKYLRTRDDFTLYSLMFNLSCVSIRRSAILNYTGYLRKIIDGTDWFVFYCALLSSGKMQFDTKILTDYRVHGSASNVLTTSASLTEIAKFSIGKFDVEGHYSLILSEFCRGTGVDGILRTKLLEERILMKIQGKGHQNITLREYMEYLKMLKYVAHPSIKSISVRFGFIFLSLFFPSITGVFYNLYRSHSLMSRLSSKSV